MGSSGVLIESSDREIQQLIGRDLGQDDWGSKVNHVSFDSDTEYAHTIRNLGVGGALNIAKSTDGSTLLHVNDTSTEIATLTVTGGTIMSGDLTLDARLIMAQSVAKIVGGATSLSLRDATDANDNVLVTNAGAVTTRAGITASTGNVTITTGALVYGAAHSSVVPGATDYSIRNNANSTDNVLVTDAGAVTTRAGLTVSSGNVTLTTGALVFNAAHSSVVPGATDLSFRNNANSADNLLLTDAGVATIRAGLTVSSGNATLTTGALVFGAATSSVIPGATSLSFRNNANSADNLLISNAGAVTVRAGLTVTAGGATVSAGNLAVSSGTITASSTVQGTQLISTVSTGTAPLTVSSTTLVSNLNVQFLNGHPSSDFITSLSGAVLTDGSSQTKSGALTVQGTFSTEGDTSIGNAVGDALSVTATATFTNSATFNGNTVLGDSSADTCNVNATMTVAGDLTTTGNTTIGNASSDTLTVVATPTFSAATEVNNTFTAQEVDIDGSGTVFALTGTSQTQTTIGGAGGASALPATPKGYFKISQGGNSYVVPFYNPV